MAAGLGFKTFTTGEVLTAADVNGYLMQGVLVFATEAARNSAITSPQEGQFAFTKDTNSLWYYSGSAWVASGATGDIEGVTAGVGISGGGTSGTVTITNSMATAIDAKGDLVAGTGADTFSRLAVGANGTVLTADSAEATGLKWATPAGGGKLLQVVTAVSSGYIAITGNNVYADANLSATITPSSATSRILVLVTQGFGSYQNTASDSNNAYAKIMRGATTVWQSDATSANGVTYTSKAYAEVSWTTITLHYVDSPSSTSALTYKTQWKQSDNSNDHSLYMNYGTYPSQITLFEIGA